MWKRICEIPGYTKVLPCYFVDDTGRVYTHKGNVKVIQDPGGYDTVRLNTRAIKKNKSGVISYKTKKLKIHRIVANAFLYRIPHKHGDNIHHKDFNKHNNDYRNLEWIGRFKHIRLHQMHQMREF